MYWCCFFFALQQSCVEEGISELPSTSRQWLGEEVRCREETLCNHLQFRERPSESLVKSVRLVHRVDLVDFVCMYVYVCMYVLCMYYVFM